MSAVYAAADPLRTEMWTAAVTAAAVFSIDPQGIGGVRLRAAPGALRDDWFDRLHGFLESGTPMRRAPCGIDDSRLLGGIDLAATLRSGRPVAERGLLAQVDHGVLVVRMAERMGAGTAARMAAALDDGAVRLERDGFSTAMPARVAVVACDEGIGPDERPPAGLLDRLGVWLELDEAPAGNGAPESDLSIARLQGARERVAAVTASPAWCEALCSACAALGVDSLRVPLLALRVARAAAALDGADAVGREHAALAARLVRRMAFDLAVSKGSLYLTFDDQTLSGTVTTYRPGGPD